MLMRSVAQPVAVLLSQGADEADVHGCTLSSCTPVALDPPTVAFSLRPGHMADRLAGQTDPTFDIHFLGHRQAAAARHYARQSDGAAPPTAEAIARDAVGSLRCLLLHSMPLHNASADAVLPSAGSSRLFLARVLGASIGQADGPLLWWKGRYRSPAEKDVDEDDDPSPATPLHAHRSA